MGSHHERSNFALMNHVEDSLPYPWPFDATVDLSSASARSNNVTNTRQGGGGGRINGSNTCLVIIDMQNDFCKEGGYVHRMGYDISLVQRPIENLRMVLKSARGCGLMVVHTREGHREELLDLPKNKRFRSKGINAEIGTEGPLTESGERSQSKILTRNNFGWEIIEELSPIKGECVIDKPGKGSFLGTDLDLILRTNDIKRIIFGGITTDVCVHTTMREANDMGYECLLLEDGTGATDLGNHLAAIKMVHMQNGVFGATATCANVCKLLDQLRFDAPLCAKNDSDDKEEEEKEEDTTIVIKNAIPFPFEFKKSKTALIMIDWQLDFTSPNGFGASLGNDCSELTKEALPNASRILKACRDAKIAIVHTLESHAPDMSDCPKAKLKRCSKIGEIVDEKMGRILIRGESGNDIEPSVKPIKGELIIHKPGKGAFFATDLEYQLKRHGIEQLIFTGVTTEVCVNTSMREANDRGFECIVLDDATASYFPRFKEYALEMISSQGAIVGWRCLTDEIINAILSS